MKSRVPSRIALQLALFATLCLALGAAVAAVLADEGERGGPKVNQTPIPVATPLPGTPVMDRLAPPPTVAAPTQADDGAQLYWLHCQPCHGDVGQGLTDEWRAQYPPEDQYCWESGCHGERPYENGFTLPFTVPAVIGEGTLTRYRTMGGLYRYIQVAMPYWNPGSLTEDEYLAITAHLARAHGVWDGSTLLAANVDAMDWPAGLAAAAAERSGAAMPPVDAEGTPAASIFNGGGILLWGGLVAALVAIAGGALLWQRFNR